MGTCLSRLHFMTSRLMATCLMGACLSRSRLSITHLIGVAQKGFSYEGLDVGSPAMRRNTCLRHILLLLAASHGIYVRGIMSHYIRFANSCSGDSTQNCQTSATDAINTRTAETLMRRNIENRTTHTSAKPARNKER